jgi:hypothetical protein
MTRYGHRENSTDDYFTRITTLGTPEGENINTYVRSKGGVSGKGTAGAGHISWPMRQTRTMMNETHPYFEPLRGRVAVAIDNIRNGRLEVVVIRRHPSVVQEKP